MTNSHPLLRCYEPFKKKIFEVKHLQCASININETILNESLGVFEGQYEIAEYLSNISYEMLNKKTNKNTVNVEQYKTWLKYVNLTLNIEYDNLLPNINARLEKIGTDSVNIIINVSYPCLNIYNETIMKNKILNCITHELMHDNIFIKRYTNGIEEFDDTPDEYPIYIQIMDENNPNTLLYKFGLALYSTFYQETQAIISQTVSNLRLILMKQDVSNDEIKSAIAKSEGYIRFNIILHELVPVLEHMSDDELFQQIELPLFSKYALNIKPKKLIKKFKNRSTIALRKIIKSAMLINKNIN